jgi:hypothetical protein
MFALIALICFILAAFGVALGAVNLLAVGLAFVALHLMWSWTPWEGRINVHR